VANTVGIPHTIFTVLAAKELNSIEGNRG